jgi:hypothetical protein
MNFVMTHNAHFMCNNYTRRLYSPKGKVLALLGPALAEELLLGFSAFAFSDGARVKCGSFESESGALPPVDGGGAPFFSDKRDGWSPTLSGSTASSTGAVLFLPAAENALNSWSTTKPIARNESSVGDLSPADPAEHTPPMATNADAPSIERLTCKMRN